MLRYSSYNAVYGNTITADLQFPESASTGLILFNQSRHNAVQGNTFAGFPRGLGLYYGSDGNVITGNQFSAMVRQAAIVDGASGNHISGNNFLSAGNVPFDDGANEWDDGGNGNYWAAYSGPDQNGDGIGDAPYLIAPSGADRFPRTSPLTLVPPAPPVLADAPVPVLPDRMALRVNTSQVISNQSINLDFIDVLPGGDLTLRNVHLISGGNPNAASGIQVYGGGRLAIEDSVLSQEAYGSGCHFLAHAGSALTMRNSELHDCGQEWWYGGLQVYTSDFTLENNLFAGTILWFSGVSGGTLRGNTILDSFQSLALDDSTVPVVGNHFAHSIHTAFQASGDRAVVLGNDFHDIWENGVNLYGGSGHLVEGNTIWNTAPGFAGLAVTGRDSSVLSNTIHNTDTGLIVYFAGEQATVRVENNRLSDSDTCLAIGAHNATVRNNTASRCQKGVSVAATGNTFSGNIIRENAMGLQVASGQRNLFFDNLFLYNEVQAQDYGYLDAWDNGARGNCWSDYTGSDTNHDGIGDTPYLVHRFIVDRYPLICPRPWRLYLPSLERS
jgi:parallel beta-helix repeat protein